jgi:hypothetical protein
MKLPQVAVAICAMVAGMGASPVHAQKAFDRLDCLAKSEVEAVRRAPAQRLAKLYEACSAELGDKLASLALTDSQQRMVFASVLAQAMAPYGSSAAMSLAELLKAKVLDCDNYAILAGHFARILLGEQGTVKLLGFDGGAVGNHAQVLFEDAQGGALLLDPTTGLVAVIGFNQLLQGDALDADKMLVFRQHTDKDIDAFAQSVMVAVREGKYQPSDILYFFASMEEYVAFSREIEPLWKSDIRALMRRFPTPAAQALRRNIKS